MASSTVKAIPDGMHTITPHIICANAPAAMDWYARALGAQELVRLMGPNGKLMHGLMSIGDSKLMLMEEMAECQATGPLALKGTPVTLHLYVDDVDAAFGRAVEAGAAVRMPPTDMFWGDRYSVITDPSGHCWAIATHKQDLSEDEIKANMAKQCG